MPSGFSQTSSKLFYYEMVEGGVPGALEAELEKPGRLLATRQELWDTAADLALARWLGWWRSSANVPDTHLVTSINRCCQNFDRCQMNPAGFADFFGFLLQSFIVKPVSKMPDQG